MKNKKGITKIQRIGMGTSLGFLGIILISFGSFTSQIWIMRGGIALTTFGVWLSTWN